MKYVKSTLKILFKHVNLTNHVYICLYLDFYLIQIIHIFDVILHIPNTCNDVSVTVP